MTTLVDIQQHCANDPGLDLPWVRSRIEAAIAHLGAEVRQARVAVVDDASMTALHLRHLRCETTTDVLTFCSSGPQEPIDVDIAVCVDEARRQAMDRGHDVNGELLLYVIHGLLHCAGHDDHDDDAYEAMHAEEDRILCAIGMGPLFNGHDGSRSRDSEGRGNPGVNST